MEHIYIYVDIDCAGTRELGRTYSVSKALDFYKLQSYILLDRRSQDELNKLPPAGHQVRPVSPTWRPGAGTWTRGHRLTVVP